MLKWLETLGFGPVDVTKVAGAMKWRVRFWGLSGQRYCFGLMWFE